MPYPNVFPTQQMMQVGMFLRGGPNAPAKPVVLQAAYDCLGFGLATLVPVPAAGPTPAPGPAPAPTPPTPAPPGPTPPEPPSPPPPPTGPGQPENRPTNAGPTDASGRSGPAPQEKQKQASRKADRGQQAEALKEHQQADQEELAKLKGEVAQMKGQPGPGSTTDAESGKATQASAEGSPQTSPPGAPDAGGGPRAGEGGGPQAPGEGNVRGVPGDVKYQVEQPPKQGAELADELDGWTRDMTNRFGGAAGAGGTPGGGFTHPEVQARQQIVSPSLGAPSNVGRGGVPQSPHELPTTLANAGQGAQYSFSVPPWLVPVLLNVIQQILQA